MIGQIYGIFGSFFQIKLLKNCQKITAKAKGNFKSQKQQLLVGDFVQIELKPDKLHLITKLLKRKNQLQRPSIANVDNVFIINALKEPTLDFCFLNKILIWLEVYTDVKIFLLFTKKDLLTDNQESKTLLKTVAYYQKSYSLWIFSNKEKTIITRLKKQIQGTSVFLGRSGVGKSTLINLLDPKLQIKTKTVSSKNKLGRHQTVVSRYYEIENSLVADTPGFNNQSLKNITKLELITHFKPLQKYQNKCFFQNCSHDHEPECQLKKAAKKSFRWNFFAKVWKKLLDQHQKDLTN